jgi:hypothetical protein
VPEPADLPELREWLAEVTRWAAEREEGKADHRSLDGAAAGG